MTPSRMKAVVTLADGQVELREVDVPKPGSGQILVKVFAAAQNPTDWKTVQRVKTEGNTVGCDFAGTVEVIGPGVPDGLRKIGERVASFVHGSVGPNGAFAEYVVADARVIISIPDHWSFEEAAQLGIASYTACQCLYQSQSLPTPLEPTSTPTDLLVWAGTSAVGQYVVQLATLAGLRVISTASTKNFGFVKSLGASEVFDYKDAETPKKIRKITSGQLKHAVDCVSEKSTPAQVSEALSDEGGTISAILPYTSGKEGVTTNYSLAYSLLGQATTLPRKTEANPAHYELGIKFSKLISEVLASGKVKPSPVKLFPKGLASVAEGFEYMKAGKVSAEKVTYRISDTP